MWPQLRNRARPVTRAFAFRLASWRLLAMQRPTVSGNMHVCAHATTHAPQHAHAHTPPHTHMHTRHHARTTPHKHTHAHTSPCTHPMHTHIYTCTHTHAHAHSSYQPHAGTCSELCWTFLGRGKTLSPGPPTLWPEPVTKCPLTKLLLALEPPGHQRPHDPQFMEGSVPKPAAWTKQYIFPGKQ